MSRSLARKLNHKSHPVLRALKSISPPHVKWRQIQTRRQIIPKSGGWDLSRHPPRISPKWNMLHVVFLSLIARYRELVMCHVASSVHSPLVVSGVWVWSGRDETGYCSDHQLRGFHLYILLLNRNIRHNVMDTTWEAVGWKTCPVVRLFYLYALQWRCIKGTYV